MAAHNVHHLQFFVEITKINQKNLKISPVQYTYKCNTLVPKLSRQGIGDKLNYMSKHYLVPNHIFNRALWI